MESIEAVERVTIRTVEEVLAYIEMYLDDHRREPKETRYCQGFYGALEMVKRELSLAAKGRLQGGSELKLRLQSLRSSSPSNGGR